MSRFLLTVTTSTANSQNVCRWLDWTYWWRTKPRHCSSSAANRQQL